MVAERTRLAVLGEDTINFQNHYRHRDGSCRWLEWMIRPDASTSSLYAIARDITTGKEAEDSLQLLVEQLAIIQRAIAERSRLDEILDTIVQAVVKVLGREIAGLRLIDENDPSYVVLAASTRLDEKATRILRRGPVTDGIAGRATVEERLLISNDYGSGEAEIQMLGHLWSPSGHGSTRLRPWRGRREPGDRHHDRAPVQRSGGRHARVLRRIRRRRALGGARRGRSPAGADRSAHRATQPRALPRPPRTRGSPSRASVRRGLRAIPRR
jgi:hypothetical protein